MSYEIQFGKDENWKNYKFFRDIWILDIWDSDEKFIRLRFQNLKEVDHFLQRLATAVEMQKLKETQGDQIKIGDRVKTINGVGIIVDYHVFAKKFLVDSGRGKTEYFDIEEMEEI